MKLTNKKLLAALSNGGKATSDRRDQLGQWICLNHLGEIQICDDLGTLSNTGLDIYDLQDETWRVL